MVIADVLEASLEHPGDWTRVWQRIEDLSALRPGKRCPGDLLPERGRRVVPHHQIAVAQQPGAPRGPRDLGACRPRKLQGDRRPGADQAVESLTAAVFEEIG